MQKLTTFLLIFLALTGCKAAGSEQKEGENVEISLPAVAFDADSAYNYVKKQVDFGPRVPNSMAHDMAREWLASELKRHGAEVAEQKMDIRAHDGVTLRSTNIIGQYNPNAEERVLLVAHYDCRPWADQDPNPENYDKPVDGANDGASGVGVLLEIARQLSKNNPSCGVDILFVDAEDYGNDDEETWALGSKYFVEHPFKPDYLPSEVILLDMVGGRDAKFYREYFSQKNAGQLLSAVWGIAEASGFGSRFVDKPGGAVNDDHLRFQDAGIPSIDIIEFVPGTGFNASWHTVSDTMENIDAGTLKAVGQTVLNYVLTR
ncbi:MAG: M28 family peptidase [Prevotella sp.]|nr:M28 family peptidase [Bacteroides sp.]MCM1367136.1 M28 family peptidase [Prevotella sp.]MCM1437566.1 M28 family peptidase [Prevotella sp.]